MTRTAFVIAAALAALWATGCASRPGARPHAPAPVPAMDLAGATRAAAVAEPAQLPGGPGAEGRVGDFVLENAYARFVVAAAPRRTTFPLHGNLIDAALQGGEDRLRVVVPLLGTAPDACRPVYADVRVGRPGGEMVSATVEAIGSLPGRPDVRLHTVYSLQPDSVRLLITTRVDNATGDMLSVFGCRDEVMPGRTERFVPGMGRCPAGRSGPARWLALSGGGYTWGLAATGSTEMEVHNGATVTTLGYRTVDIPAGQGESYGRVVVLGRGGPEAVWSRVTAGQAASSALVGVIVSDAESGRPVGGADVSLAPLDGRPGVLMRTGADGRAALNVPPGDYTLSARAPGRSPTAAMRVRCVDGMTHEVSVGLPPPTGLSLEVRGQVGAIVAPTAARVAAYAGNRTTPPPVAGPPFPGAAWAGVQLADGPEAVELPLVAPSDVQPGRYALSVSKGPLFGYAGGAVIVHEGQAAERQALLVRAVDPHGYVSVDFRQHSDRSPDCPLTAQERLRANAAEGLDAAVVSDHAPDVALAAADHHETVALDGLRVEVPGVGRFSVFPIDATAGPSADAVTEAKTAQEALDLLRQAFPRALIQMDDPLDEQSGCLTRVLRDVREGASAGGALPKGFDALELLTGRHVDRAQKLLPMWFGMLNAGRRVVATGGSGSRSVVGETAGLARTFVRVGGAAGPPSRRSVARALLGLRSAPDAFVTNGPFVEAALNGRPIGSTQRAADGPMLLTVRVGAPPWVDVSRVVVYRNGERVHDVPVPHMSRVVRCDRRLEVDVPSDCWFVVVVYGERPMAPVYAGGLPVPTPFAVTNPFWVDADGDGRVRPRP